MWFPKVMIAIGGWNEGGKKYSATFLNSGNAVEEAHCEDLGLSIFVRITTSGSLAGKKPTKVAKVVPGPSNGFPLE